MGLLIFYLLLALVVSFFCSLLEAVLLSITPSYIEAKLNAGKVWAKRTFEYKKDIDKPLAAILSLNTIAHTVGAAGVGAQAGKVLSSVSMGIISGVLTFLILVFSELIPKTLGARFWKSFTFFTTKSLQFLMIPMYPFVLLSQLIAKAIKRSDEPTVERSEVVALAEIGRREGVFSSQEAKILTNIIKLRSITVRDIMTPRTVMVAAAESMTIGEFQAEKKYHRYSRIPLYKLNKDNITGFIHKHDLLHGDEAGMRDENTPLKELSRTLPVVDQHQNLYSTYQFMVEGSAHIALVVEEFGGTAGLVTMEDIIETLLGMEIMDEFDATTDMREYARNRWRERATRMGLEVDDDNTQETT